MSEFSKSNSTSQSEDIREFAQAFLKASTIFKKTGLSGRTDKYKYAKLEEIYGAVEDGLRENNISIWHCADTLDTGMEILKSRLTHTLSGQYIEDRRFITSEKPGNQAKGAANTYMKKYAILSMCAISAEQDDDCQEEEKHIQKLKVSEPVLRVTEAQVAAITIALKESSNGKTLYGNILKFNQASALSDIKASAYESIMSYIQKNKD